MNIKIQIYLKKENRIKMSKMLKKCRKYFNSNK